MTVGGLGLESAEGYLEKKKKKTSHDHFHRSPGDSMCWVVVGVFLSVLSARHAWMLACLSG